MSQLHLYSKDRTPDQSAPLFVVSVELGELEKQDDKILLFAPVASADEVDSEIDRLIIQLNAVRRKAKEKLADRLRE